MSTEAPPINSTWRHKNGNVYRVAVITNEGSQSPNYVPTVVYVNVVLDTWWSRPVSDWHRSMTRIDS